MPNSQRLTLVACGGLVGLGLAHIGITLCDVLRGLRYASSNSLAPDYTALVIPGVLVMWPYLCLITVHRLITSVWLLIYAAYAPWTLVIFGMSGHPYFSSKFPAWVADVVSEWEGVGLWISLPFSIALAGCAIYALVRLGQVVKIMLLGLTTIMAFLLVPPACVHLVHCVQMAHEISGSLFFDTYFAIAGGALLVAVTTWLATLRLALKDQLS